MELADTKRVICAALTALAVIMCPVVSLARYVQADPVGLQGGLNPYEYVDSAPLDATDPDGLQARPPRGPAVAQPMFPPIGPSATAPVGNARVPIEIRRGSNAPGEVGGLPFSGHSLDRMQGRGIPPSAVLNAIQNGQRSPGSSPNTTQYYDLVNNVTVVVNTNTGLVVTVRNGRPRSTCP